MLITRAAEDAPRTARLIEDRGFTPVAAPLIQVCAREPALPGRVQAILVTSGNALARLPVRDVPLLAVGDTTAARARAAGFARVASAGGDGAALVALAAETLDPGGGALLLACGAGQGGQVAAGLRAAGFAVVRRVTYAVAPVRGFPAAAAAALAAQRLHGAIFMSAETARLFVRLLPRPLAPALENVLALAIGKAAADALKPLPWRQVRVACTPTLDDVLALL